MKTINSHFLIILLAFCFLIVGCGERYYKGEDSHTVELFDQNPGNSSSSNTSKDAFKEISGRVIKIADGDTFTLIFENDFEVRVRLNGIDCPEKKQAFSKKAKDALTDLIFGKMVLVKYKSKDGRGRVLGDVFVEGTNVNQEIVRRGLAWHYIKYSDDAILDRLEREARMNKIGLWFDPNPVPPWEYRKQ